MYEQKNLIKKYKKEAKGDYEKGRDYIIIDLYNYIVFYILCKIRLCTTWVWTN